MLGPDRGHRCGGVKGSPLNVRGAIVGAILALGTLVTACTSGGSDTIVGSPLSVTITKTATPSLVPETGGDVQFTVKVTNNGTEQVTINSLQDSVFDLGQIVAADKCSDPVGTTLQPEEIYTCTFSEFLSGDAANPHQNTVTVRVSNTAGASADWSADATVNFGTAPPIDISILKTPTPSSVPETGGTVEFAIIVDNNGAGEVTIDSLQDSVFDLGQIVAADECSDPVGTTLQPGEVYSCTFSEFLSGDATNPHQNTVTVRVSNPDGASADYSADATVSFTTAPPIDISILKTATPSSVPETGGTVEFAIIVDNNGAGDVTIDSLQDSVFDLTQVVSTECLDAVGVVLPAAGHYSCTFSKFLSGHPDTPHQNAATVMVSNDVEDDTKSTSATVHFSEVLVLSFDPATPCPGPMAIRMQPESIVGVDLDLEIAVDTVDNFFGAAFHVRFDHGSAVFTGYDSTGSFLHDSAAGADFRVVAVGIDEIAVSATLVGDGAGIPDASGRLITLRFQATGLTPGNTFEFMPVTSRTVRVCPTAGQPCNEVQGDVTWCGGTLVVD